MRRVAALSQPLTATLFPLVVAIAASAAAAGLIASGDARTLAVAGLGVVVVGALMRWPALALISLLIVCQELDPGLASPGTSSSGLLYIGYQLYFRTFARISLITLLVVIVLGRALIASRPLRPRRSAALLVLGLGAYVSALLWVGGSSLTSAVNQDARFAILFGGCFAVGVAAANSTEWARHGVTVIQWVLSAMVLIGLYLAATSAGAGPGGTRIIFYDAATGAIAGAAMLAALLTPRAERTWRLWWIAGAGLMVVILSARRDVWAAVIVALLLSLMFTRERMRLVVRLLAAAVVALLALEVFAPSTLSGIGHQLSAIWGATRGTAADASVKGHLSDISLGWKAVTASPLSGVGPHGQVLGLIVEGNSQLYIHNQILETWLRFGLFGAILVIAAQVVFVVQGLSVMRRTRTAFTTRWAAQLLVLAPVSLLTAPFLTNTQRWPAALGFAAGLAGTALAQNRSADVLDRPPA